jgi:hypothetical protein
LVAASLFQVGAAGFEFLDRGFGGAARQLLRDQEVAGIAFLDLDDIAQVAELADLLEKNDLHGWAPLRPCVDRSTAAAPGSGRA